MSTTAAIQFGIRLVFRPARPILAAVALVLLAQPAASQTPKSSAGAFCSSSAEAADTACANDVQADFWLAVGACRNEPDAAERQACLSAADRQRGKARRLCSDQLGGRDAVCDDLGEAAYDPPINPANFVHAITNRYFPLKPGTTFIYRGRTDAGTERVVVSVQHQTVRILGVECTQVRDTVTVDGEVVEDTLDWFAQDRQGNVWYFGESTQEFEDGLPVSLEGSWRAGAEGAKPGIVMKAHPAIGDIYRQEFLLGSAEDLAEVLSLAGRATAPGASCHGNCVVTHDFTPLEPDLNEQKFYAPHVGFILEVDQETGDRLELIEIRRP